MELGAMTMLLHEGNFSCVIFNNETRTFTQRGVKDIYDILHDDFYFLRGATVADKVVGKAAAALLALGGVKRVHADVISCPAYSLLQKYGVQVEYGQCVGMIWNRDGTDSCPLEKLCAEEEDLLEIFYIVDKFLSCKCC